jgi:hypothetical protein
MELSYSPIYEVIEQLEIYTILDHVFIPHLASASKLGDKRHLLSLCISACFMVLLF